MPRLPPVDMSPQARLLARLTSGATNSVRTFFQSASSSSATSCASPVIVPCPISERAMRIVVVSSGSITTQTPISRLPPPWAAAPRGTRSPKANAPAAALTRKSRRFSDAMAEPLPSRPPAFARKLLRARDLRVKVIGLTGGIGMGKSTAATAFRRAGIPVFDADAAVHALQARGGRAVRAIGRAFPGTVRDGAVDRDALRQAVVFDTAALRRLEAIIHPMVRREERAFLARARRAGDRAAVLDIPLLLETGGDRRVDQVVVVSAPPDVQRHRVRLRRRMSPAQIEAVIARQMPDRDKRR